MDKYKFASDPIANPESIVAGEHYRFTLINEHVLRYEWAADGVFEDRASTFAINRNFPPPAFRFEDREDQLEIIAPAFHLTYDKQRFSPHGFSIAFTSKQTEWGDGWRYGTAADGNLGGTARTIDGVDGRCDVGAGIISTAGYAVLGDSDSMLFDGQGFVATRRPGDRIDGYLFIYGHDFKGAMRSFYAIAGAQPHVPRWCLGNWWSRYHAYSHTEYLALMDNFEAKKIPLSVAVIDMDWHRVKGDDIPHVGWTGYTWNRALFPDPKAFTKALHNRKLKVTLNDHPHSGVHSHEEMYEEMAAALDHPTSHHSPILFDSTSPAYMHAYLNIVHRRLAEQGCDFPWLDWQQGQASRIPGLDPLWLLNHFHYLHQIATRGESKALIFSRYAGPGSHRYPVGFSGDSFATWASLRFQPEFTATASNIGYGWWSHDIGGHIGASRDDECTVRWVQFGAFSPTLRLHSSNSRWMSKEPWLYRPESENAMRGSMQLRHRLVPYIYSSVMAETPSLPLVQPLYWNHPLRDLAYQFPNEYYFGPSLVVAPIVHPRDPKTNLAKKHVWIPSVRRHVDIFTGTVYDGEREIDLYRPLHQIPVLAAEGAIIPLDGAAVPANGCHNPASFEVLVVVGRDGRFDIIENTSDDEGFTTQGGSGRRSIPIEYDQTQGRLKVPSSGRAWSFRFLSTSINPSSIKVSLDGKQWSQAQSSIDTTTSTAPSTVVSVPASSEQNSQIVIELGANPQLDVLDHTQNIHNLLLDFQIPNELKDKIWNVIRTSWPTTSAVATLFSLDIERNWLGPLVELLMADWRGLQKEVNASQSGLELNSG